MRVTEETKNATRRRILAAAQSLFARRGYESATTRDIARAAQIANGTLFNYFPTKESIALCLVNEAYAKATEAFKKAASSAEGELSLEEELFAHVAAGLRKLKPFRAYLSAVLEISLSPAIASPDPEAASLRAVHLETVGRIIAQHRRDDALSPIAFQLYWTLYTGVLAFWTEDSSPKQEDTLALLDQSLAMYVGWLTLSADNDAFQKKQRKIGG